MMHEVLLMIEVQKMRFVLRVIDSLLSKQREDSHLSNKLATTKVVVESQVQEVNEASKVVPQPQPHQVTIIPKVVLQSQLPQDSIESHMPMVVSQPDSLFRSEYFECNIIHNGVYIPKTWLLAPGSGKYIHVHEYNRIQLGTPTIMTCIEQLSQPLPLSYRLEWLEEALMRSNLSDIKDNEYYQDLALAFGWLCIKCVNAFYVPFDPPEDFDTTEGFDANQLTVNSWLFKKLKSILIARKEYALALEVIRNAQVLGLDCKTKRGWEAQENGIINKMKKNNSTASNRNIHDYLVQNTYVSEEILSTITEFSQMQIIEEQKLFTETGVPVFTQKDRYDPNPYQLDFSAKWRKAWASGQAIHIDGQFQYLEDYLHKLVYRGSRTTWIGETDEHIFL